MIEQYQVGLGPGRIAQIPKKVKQVAPLGIRTLQKGMQLSGEKGGLIVMLELEHNESPNHAGSQDRASRWLCVNFQLHRQHFIGLSGEPQFIQQTGKTPNGTLDRPGIIDF